MAFHFRSCTDEISMPAMLAPIATIDGRVLDTLDRLIERHLFPESKIPQIPTINACESVSFTNLKIIDTLELSLIFSPVAFSDFKQLDFPMQDIIQQSQVCSRCEL